MSVKGYKVIGPDWTCRGFKYEVGKTYKHIGDIKICEQGFHFCEKAVDCFRYYPFDSSNHIVEVEALGLVNNYGVKAVTNEIKIVREINWSELLEIINGGKGCTGYKNMGDYNTGCCNMGNYNVGNFNVGDCNVGSRNSSYRNTGYGNTGSWNAGDQNTGVRNTGMRNSGNWNSGDWNSGDYNSGFFCTDTPKARAFNVQTDISVDEWLNIKGVQILDRNYQNTWWVDSQDMTDKEKTEHPEHECMGGYLKTIDFKEACAIMWNKLTEEEKQTVTEIPYFNAEIFKEITGIDVTE